WIEVRLLTDGQTVSQYMRLNRRDWLRRIGMGSAVAALLPACTKAPEEEAPVPGKPEEGSLIWAIEGNWRNASHRDRDRFRHPIETIEFFGIDPRDTVIDVWPGSGYMTG